MNERELLNNVKDLLRKAIASRLKIAKTDYDASLSTQIKVNRWLTNIMSMGHNKGSMVEVLEELCTARHFGHHDDTAVIGAMRKEMIETQRLFGPEITAFTIMHEMNEDGEQPEAVWAHVQSMIALADDYKKETGQRPMAGSSL